MLAAPTTAGALQKGRCCFASRPEHCREKGCLKREPLTTAPERRESSACVVCQFVRLARRTNRLKQRKCRNETTAGDFLEIVAPDRNSSRSWRAPPKSGIHCALETSGDAEWESFAPLLPYIDLYPHWYQRPAVRRMQTRAVRRDFRETRRGHTCPRSSDLRFRPPVHDDEFGSRRVISSSTAPYVCPFAARRAKVCTWIVGTKSLVILAVLVSVSRAQNWEIGGSVGYGAYRSGTVFGGNGQTATAQVLNRFTAGAVVGEQTSEYISGELRWTYQDGHVVLTSRAVREEIVAQSHALTYDVLFHLKARDRRLRPFIAAGGGVKGYIANGPPPLQNPLSGVASLVARDEWKPVLDIGGGIKYRAAKNVLLRLDFRDYISTFPKRQIVPAPNSTARGIFQQFTPMFGVSYMF